MRWVDRHPAYCCRGIATALLDRREDLLRLRGCRALRAIFELGRPNTDDVQGLLRK